mmetsp:Transcript_10457/g.33082  ORF Transcript_10457/g.33082 Transcript_10457/m.33082 type:complete len:234 (-) Transcript_10457:370-1071(-)
MASCSLAVLVHEGLHEVTELLHALHGHAVIQGSAAATHGAVPSQRVKLLLLRPVQELFLQLLVPTHDDKGDVHPGARRLLNGTTVETIGAINGIVDQAALLRRKFCPMRNAANLLGVFQILAHDVHCEASRCVVHGTVLGSDLPAAVGRADLEFVLASCELWADEAHRDARGAQVLLQARVDVRVLADLDRLGAEVRGHVRNERHAADIRGVAELHTVHSLVGAVVDVGGLRI